MQAEIYTKPNCKYCTMAKTVFVTRGIPFVEIDAVDQLPALKQRIMESGSPPPKSVPQIFIDQNYVGGYDNLVQLLAVKY